MPASESDWSITRAEHLFHADCTVILKSVCFALMISFSTNAHAHIANITMKSEFSSTNSANSTLITVKDLLFDKLIIEEFAHITVIPRKFDPARITRWLDLS